MQVILSCDPILYLLGVITSHQITLCLPMHSKEPAKKLGGGIQLITMACLSRKSNTLALLAATGFILICCSTTNAYSRKVGMKNMGPYLPDPTPTPNAVVWCDEHARFTILSPVLVRAEFCGSYLFEDRATFAFVNRRTQVPEFTVSNTSNLCTITIYNNSTKQDISVIVRYNKTSSPQPSEAPFYYRLTVQHPSSGISYTDGINPPMNGTLGGTVYQLNGVDQAIPR